MRRFYKYGVGKKAAISLMIMGIAICLIGCKDKAVVAKSDDQINLIQMSTAVEKQPEIIVDDKKQSGYIKINSEQLAKWMTDTSWQQSKNGIVDHVPAYAVNMTSEEKEIGLSFYEVEPVLVKVTYDSNVAYYVISVEDYAAFEFLVLASSYFEPYGADAEEGVNGDGFIQDVEKKEAVYELTDITGADGVTLDYASDDQVVFHGSFGFFVYDLKEQKITRSLDLESIGCHYTQGDQCCEVSVDQTGTRVRLHPMNLDIMYGYFVDQDSLEKRVDEPIYEAFQCEINPNASGAMSCEMVTFANGETGYLSYDGETLDDLYYIRGSKQYKLFGK